MNIVLTASIKAIPYLTAYTGTTPTVLRNHRGGVKAAAGKRFGDHACRLIGESDEDAAFELSRDLARLLLWHDIELYGENPVAHRKIVWREEFGEWDHLDLYYYEGRLMVPVEAKVADWSAYVDALRGEDWATAFYQLTTLAFIEYDDIEKRRVYD